MLETAEHRVSGEHLAEVLLSITRRRENSGTRERRAPRHLRAVGAEESVAASEGQRRSGCSTRAGMKLFDRLYTLIVAHWASTLESVFDWAERPLTYYTFSAQFLQVVEHMSHAALDQVAWVCAMIACGLADEYNELDLQPGPGRKSPGDSGDARAAGAQAWLCLLRPAGGNSVRLGYWIHPDSRIEFDSLEAGP